MAIESRPFGGVILTGEDAAEFRRWMESREPAPVAALESLRRGKEMIRQFNQTGMVTFTVECKN